MFIMWHRVKETFDISWGIKVEDLDWRKVQPDVTLQLQLIGIYAWLQRHRMSWDTALEERELLELESMQSRWYMTRRREIALLFLLTLSYGCVAHIRGCNKVDNNTKAQIFSVSCKSSCKSTPPFRRPTEYITTAVACYICTSATLSALDIKFFPPRSRREMTSKNQPLKR